MDDFAKEFGVHLYQRGEGVIHQLMYEKHRAQPGELVVIADSHTGTCGGYGAVGVGVGSTELAAAMTRVCIHNTNTGKLLYADVEVENGRAKVKGDCEIAGVPGTGSPILMDFSNTAGAATGKVLPTGNPVDILETSRGPIQISIVDVANPCVFVLAKDVGMSPLFRRLQSLPTRATPFRWIP